MEASNIIRRKERYALLLFSFLVFALVASVISWQAIASYNKSVEQAQNDLHREAGGQVISFAACGGPSYTVAGLNLITFFIFLSFIRPRRFIVSSVLILFYAALFCYGIFARLNGEGTLGSKDFFTDKWYELYMKTYHMDYLIALIITTFLAWQFTIIWRIIRSRKADPVLP